MSGNNNKIKIKRQSSHYPSTLRTSGLYVALCIYIYIYVYTNPSKKFSELDSVKITYLRLYESDVHAGVILS